MSNENRAPKKKFSQLVEKFGIFGITIMLIIIGMIVSPNFLTFSNILNILDAISYLGILAAGMALVTYAGQSVDLSTPSSVAIGGFISVLTLRWGLIPMLVCTLLSGVLVGAVNGFVIGRFRINTVVWTLAMSFVFAGLIRVIFGSSTVYPTAGNTELFDQISRFRIGGVIPLSIIVMLSAFIVFHFLMHSTTFGLKMQLTGRSQGVAQYTGINVEAIIRICFVISGVMASITGLFIASLSRSACYNFGTGYEFRAITAIVLSGMLLDGGKGSMLGVFGGVLTIGLLNNIMTLLGVNSFLQDVVMGIVFIIVIWVTSFSMKKLEAQNA